MPVHSDTNGMGAQIPTEKYGVNSKLAAEVAVAVEVVPPHKCGRRIEYGSETAFGRVTHAGQTTVTNATGTNAAAPAIAKRRITPTIAGLPRVFPDPLLGPEFTPRAGTTSPN
jgi:hypothetical protein